MNDNCGWEHVLTDLSTFHDYNDAPALEKSCATLDSILGTKLANRAFFVPPITATASSSGEPHAAPVFYATEGTTVFFSLNASSQSYKNIKENGRASVAVGDAPDDGQDWTAAKGIQITGSVTDIDGDEERDGEQGGRWRQREEA